MFLFKKLIEIYRYFLGLFIYIQIETIKFNNQNMILYIISGYISIIAIIYYAVYYFFNKDSEEIKYDNTIENLAINNE